jgi:hypothetical protein
MFFFTRSGYITEIQRLQIALGDAQEAKLRSDEQHQQQINSLLDRLQSLLDPATLREHRRNQPQPEVVPQSLNRPQKRRPLLHNPGTKTSKQVIDFKRDQEADQKGVDAVMKASEG